MSISVFDSRIFRNTFGTPAMREIFSDVAYTKYMIEVEAALARAQAKLGVIPAEAGAAVTEALNTAEIDFDRLARETDVVGYPVLPLIRQLSEQAPSSISGFIHWGATTQDIMDNAMMLQMRAGLQIIQQEVRALIGVLSSLAEKHRDTPMAGRTHLQHALPITFGYKCAVYLSPFLQHIDRLQRIEQNNLLVQFGGAAGSMASLSPPAENGLLVRAALAHELHLRDPPITWHVARDAVAEILSLLALIGGSLGKIAYDLILLSSNEFGEVSEPFVPHRGASSTMPQKRNPISSEIILAAAKLLREKASLGLDAMVADFERQSGPWHLEWAAVPEAFVAVAGALHQANFALGGLVVNEAAMLRNLQSTRGLIVGEAVMMRTAPKLGRQRAHDLVYEACKSAIETEQPLYDVLSKNEVIAGIVDTAELRRLCDPLNYLGACQLQVDNMTRLAAQYIVKS